MMVDELKRKGEMVYTCELCGFGYKTVETAEECEEYCDLHGHSCPDITRRAIYKPPVRVLTMFA